VTQVIDQFDKIESQLFMSFVPETSMKINATVFLALLGSVLCAQEAAKPKDKPEAIQDNSFLVEEAYNQEEGVVQHISTWQKFRETKAWAYTFTQEWPVGSQLHQFSYTLPVLRTESDSSPRFGDILLNYRYQLIGDGDAKVAVSPRLSFILPTGDRDKGLGMSALGAQVNLPLSVVLAPALVAHTNAGFTWIPKAKNQAGDQADLSALNFGQSLIWLAHERFNVMLEYVHTKAQSISGPGRAEWGSSTYLSPGIRWAWNFPSGLQIVPGIAVPIGVGVSSKERAIFLYLSFEHPFKKVR
jgi:hypothetical protein